MSFLMRWKLISAFAAASLCFAADVQVIDQIVAKVNGDIVSEDELQQTKKELGQELKNQGTSATQIDEEVQKRSKDMLRDRIDELLLVQKAKELNINVDSDVTKYMTNLQRQAGIADADKFHEYVRQGTGLPFEDYLSETKNQFMTREVVGQEVGRHISISEKELRDYYESHKSDFVKEEKVYLSEILVSTEGKDAAGVAAAEKKAKQLSAAAARGERFSDLARDNSDATTAKAGGQLGGGYKKGDLAKSFEEAVWNLPKGSVTQPIRIPTGWEILKVEDHTKAGLEPLAEAKPEIENALYGPKMQPKVREYLTGLRRAAFLQVKPGFVDTGAAPGQNTKWQDPVQLKPQTVTKAEVEQKTRHKRLLWVVPIPGTETTVEGKSSSR
jgi:peptidyl-prolyl cis-trans isomerase SurA